MRLDFGLCGGVDDCVWALEGLWGGCCGNGCWCFSSSLGDVSGDSAADYAACELLCGCAVVSGWEYESCRIYFEEIEGLIDGKKGKGFYVRISGEGRSVVQRKEQGRVMFAFSIAD